MNDTFHGFSFEKERLTSVPASFFGQILPELNHLAGLKIALYTIWWLGQQESNLPYLTLDTFKTDNIFMKGLGDQPKEQLKNLEEGIEILVNQSVLLKVSPSLKNKKRDLYFLNTKKGQAAVKAISEGKISLEDLEAQQLNLVNEFPNIYTLYEENIGPLTPIIADALREFENLYPPDWIEDAFKEAIKNNVRKLNYVEAILQNWQNEGRNDRTDRGRSKKSKEEDDPERYIKGEFSDFIDH